MCACMSERRTAGLSPVLRVPLRDPRCAYAITIHLTLFIWVRERICLVQEGVRRDAGVALAEAAVAMACYERVCEDR